MIESKRVIVFTSLILFFIHFEFRNVNNRDAISIVHRPIAR